MLISRVYHFLILARQRELSQSSISLQQLLVLQAIRTLGAKATVVEIARNVERTPSVLSRQIAIMEKDGLITKSQYRQYKSKARAITLALTDHGLDTLKNNNISEAIDALLSFLSDDQRQQLYLELNRTLSELKKHTYKL